MKLLTKFVAASAISLTLVGAAHAGGYTAAAVESEPFVAEETKAAGSLGGTGGLIVGGLVGLLVIGAIASSGGDSSNGTLTAAAN